METFWTNVAEPVSTVYKQPVMEQVEQHSGIKLSQDGTLERNAALPYTQQLHSFTSNNKVFIWDDLAFFSLTNYTYKYCT